MYVILPIYKNRSRKLKYLQVVCKIVFTIPRTNLPMFFGFLPEVCVHKV